MCFSALMTLCSLSKVFGSTMDDSLILEFTKEMFTMKQFEQVSPRCNSSIPELQFFPQKY